MAETDIFEYVNALASEEERLYERAGDGSGLGDAERIGCRLSKSNWTAATTCSTSGRVVATQGRIVLR